MTVGRTRQCHQAPLAGHEVPNLDRVADGEDVGVAGAHLIIDPEPAELADLDASGASKGRVGSHAEREDHQVGSMALARLRRHGEGLAVLLEAGDPVTHHDANTFVFDEVSDELPVLGVERCKDMIGQLDDGDIEPALFEVLGHLQPDEAAPDHHGARVGSHGLEARVVVHAREKARTPLDPLANGAGIGHRADGEDAG